MTPRAPPKGTSPPVCSDGEGTRALSFPTAAGKSLDRHQPAGQSHKPKFSRNGLLKKRKKRRKRRNRDKIQPFLEAGAALGCTSWLETPKDQGTPLFVSSCPGAAVMGTAWDYEGFLGPSPGPAVPPRRRVPVCGAATQRGHGRGWQSSRAGGSFVPSPTFFPQCWKVGR